MKRALLEKAEATFDMYVLASGAQNGLNRR